MGTYTIHDDPYVDEQIEKKVQNVVRKITDAFPEICSIILTGGFGKGEGSVRITEKIVTPLRDFDFIVVFERHVPRRQFENFVTGLCQPKSESLYEYKYADNFALDIHATTIKNLNNYPDVVTFDLKEGRVVYGQDIRSKLLIESKNIPLRSGARMLFQKSTALVGVMSHRIMDKGFDSKEERDSFIRETIKVYVEIGSALCILANRYDAHSRNRLQTLFNINTDFFQVFLKEHPNLLERIKMSTKYKLDPSFNPIEIDPVKLWFQARDDLGEVAKFYFREHLRVNFREWVSYIQSIQKALREKYYSPLIENVLCLKGIPRNKYLIKSLNSIYNLKENVDFARKDKIYRLKVLLSRTSASIRFLCACFLLMFALNPDGTIADDYIQEVNKSLDFVKIKRAPDTVWNEARLRCLVLMNSINLL